MIDVKKFLPILLFGFSANIFSEDMPITGLINSVSKSEEDPAQKLNDFMKRQWQHEFNRFILDYSVYNILIAQDPKSAHYLLAIMDTIEKLQPSSLVGSTLKSIAAGLEANPESARIILDILLPASKTIRVFCETGITPEFLEFFAQVVGKFNGVSIGKFDEQMRDGLQIMCLFIKCLPSVTYPLAKKSLIAIKETSQNTKNLIKGDASAYINFIDHLNAHLEKWESGKFSLESSNVYHAALTLAATGVNTKTVGTLLDAIKLGFPADLRGQITPIFDEVTTFVQQVSITANQPRSKL